MDLKTVMSKITPLQQLLEDINFQRTKELRNLMKDGKLKKRKHFFSIFRPIIDFSPTFFVLSFRIGIRCAAGKHAMDWNFCSSFFVSKQERVDWFWRPAVLCEKEIRERKQQTSTKGESVIIFSYRFLINWIIYLSSTTQKLKSFVKTQKSYQSEIPMLTGKKHFISIWWFISLTTIWHLRFVHELLRKSFKY